MKITKIVLLLFVFLCTSNAWGQLNKDETQSLIAENRVIKDMKIHIPYNIWNGLLIIELDGRPLCTDYGRGILLSIGQYSTERTSEIDVYSGGVLSIRASREGIGDTNVISLIIPEDEIDPILIIEFASSSHFPLNAHFSGY